VIEPDPLAASGRLPSLSLWRTPEKSRRLNKLDQCDLWPRF